MYEETGRVLGIPVDTLAGVVYPEGCRESRRLKPVDYDWYPVEDE